MRKKFYFEWRRKNVFVKFNLNVETQKKIQKNNQNFLNSLGWKGHEADCQPPQAHFIQCMFCIFRQKNMEPLK
jgi:hypothetical protein